MKDYRFGGRSKRNLIGVDSNLVSICYRALELSPIDFGIMEGLRSIERQRLMVSTGKSQTMNSKHINGLAVDIVAYKSGGVITWDFNTYRTISKSFIKAGLEQGIKVTWGGSWRTIKDGVHFQINKQKVSVASLLSQLFKHFA